MAGECRHAGGGVVAGSVGTSILERVDGDAVYGRRDALRDEGVSYHYLAPGDYAACPPALATRLKPALAKLPFAVRFGATWTTDAPYRETEQAITDARGRGILAVEMEAASLYALATAQARDIVCFAHVTNRMAVHGEDFEKGAEDGTAEALKIAAAAATLLDR